MAKKEEAKAQEPAEQKGVATAKMWYLYIIRCKDNSLYTGITVDIQRRVKEHQDSSRLGKGAKFLKGKGPLQLVYSTRVPSHSAALKLEYKIKKMSKAKKEGLITEGPE